MISKRDLLLLSTAPWTAATTGAIAQQGTTSVQSSAGGAGEPLYFERERVAWRRPIALPGGSA